MSESMDKECFIEMFKNLILREGADKLLHHIINETDFFTAPASTRYHLSCEGGLVQHSINVFNRLRDEVEQSHNLETIAICALLHDLCKANYYVVEYRNAKSESGVWQKVPYYTVKDSFPYGHGEKSVYRILKYMKLTDEEAMAIRWHMGFSGEENKTDISNAFGVYPLILSLHIADMKATFWDEGIVLCP